LPEASEYVDDLIFFIYLFTGRIACVSPCEEKKMERLEYEELHAVFDSHPIKSPILQVQRITWLPTFTVTFLRKADYDYAKSNGLFETFNDRVQNRFYDKGFPTELTVNYQWLNEDSAASRTINDKPEA
jgi:hypothetical protein